MLTPVQADWPITLFSEGGDRELVVAAPGCSPLTGQGT